MIILIYECLLIRKLRIKNKEIISCMRKILLENKAEASVKNLRAMAACPAVRRDGIANLAS